MSKRRGGKGTYRNTPGPGPSRRRSQNPPSFPKGLVPPPRIGVTITSVPMPKVARAKKTNGRRHRHVQPHPVIHLPQVATMEAAEVPAIPLPSVHELLVCNEPPPIMAAPVRPEPESALPRNQSLAKPPVGLVAAIGEWLNSFGRMVAAGFIVKKKRAPLPRPPRSLIRSEVAEPSMRERTEMAQLRAENRRLRAQLDALSHVQRRLERAD